MGKLRGEGGRAWEGPFPQQAWRYPKAEADLEIEAQRDVDTRHESRQRSLLGVPTFCFWSLTDPCGIAVRTA